MTASGGGGGTTVAIAAKLGCRFITGDVSSVATRVIAKRLYDLDPPPIFSVLGIPKTKEKWLEMDGHEFAKRICEFMGWECNPKKSNDGGIDGWTKHKTVPIQIKNHRNKVGPGVIRDFVGAMGQVKEGKVVAWAFTTSAWNYRADKKHGKEIQFIKIKDILGDILIETDKKMELESLYDEKIVKEKVA